MSGARLLERGSALRFAHRVNRRDRLDAGLLSAADAFEGDVSWGRLAGTADAAERAIMAHPPDLTSDLAFEDWLEESLAAGRVVKIDLKDLAAEQAVFRHLAGRGVPREQLILNADMVAGPGAGPGGRTPVFAARHGRRWRAAFGEVAISIGSVLGQGALATGYSDGDIDRLLAAAEEVGEPVTLCLEVSLLEVRPAALERLEAAGRHITLWNLFPMTRAAAAGWRERMPAAFLDLHGPDLL